MDLRIIKLAQVLVDYSVKVQPGEWALLETDAGARFLGELGIGTSPNITRFTRSMLFDEKNQRHISSGRGSLLSGDRRQE